MMLIRFIFLHFFMCVLLVAGSMLSAQQDAPSTSLAEIFQATNLDSWRDAGWTGSGQRVGVLDRGFGGLQSFLDRTEALVEIPGGVTLETYDAHLIFQGSQVAEAIHSIAPNANLLLCQYENLTTYIQCVDWMILSDAQVIVHGSGAPTYILDGSSRWAQEVDRAANNGIFWINAAGNFATGMLRDVLTDTNDNSLHEFRGVPGNNELLRVPAVENIQQGTVMLTWESFDQRPAESIDLDLRIINITTEETIGLSSRVQDEGSGEQAIEYAVADFRQDFAIQIIDVGADATGMQFTLYVEFTTMPGSERVSNLMTPADSSSALTIAALRGTDAAPYSSAGPLVDNSQIKPDIATFGEFPLYEGNFTGTAAAAAIVGGATALVLEANTAFSNEDIRAFFLDNVESDRPFDFRIGRGRMSLPDAPEVVVSTQRSDSEAAFIQQDSNDNWIPVERDFDDVTMVLVPAGCFQMGTREGRRDELPVHEVCFSTPFWVDKFEVTNEQYGDSGWWSDSNRPREVVTWFDALAHCRSRGARLPSEAEWEYAARGVDSWLYPWGNEFVPENANAGSGSDQQTDFVGNRPDGVSWVGAMDMSGNVWEWTNSIYLPYPYIWSVERENTTDTESRRVLRGGSWVNGPTAVMSTRRTAVEPTFSLNNTGFRCAHNFE